MNLSLNENSIFSYAGLFFLFPLGMSSVRHFSSTLFVLMALVALWGGISYKYRLHDQHVQIVCAFLCFIFVISLSLINAHDIAEGFNRLGKMAYFIVLVPLYFATRAVHSHMVGYFMWGLVCAGPINFLIAFNSVYFQEMSRAQGYYHPIIFGDLNLLAAMLLSVFIFSGYLKNRIASFLGPFSVLCFLFSCYLSGTRGAWLALPVALSVALLLYRASLTKRLVGQMLIGLILLVSIICVTQKLGGEHSSVRTGEIFPMTLNNITSFSRGENLNTSLGQRFLMWGIAVDMMKAEPLFGSGIGGFSNEVERLQREGKTVLKIAWPHAHSIYFEFLGTTGLLGLLSMLTCLFIVPGIVFMKTLSGTELQRMSASAGLVFLFCFATFGLTECWLYRSPMLITYIVCLLIFTTGCLNKNEYI